jgi:hypothetical protein
VTLQIAKPLKRVGALYHKHVNGQSRSQPARVNRPGRLICAFRGALEPALDGSRDIYRLESF